MPGRPACRRLLPMRDTAPGRIFYAKTDKYRLPDPVCHQLKRAMPGPENAFYSRWFGKSCAGQQPSFARSTTKADPDALPDGGNQRPRCRFEALTSPCTYLLFQWSC